MLEWQGIHFASLVPTCPSGYAPVRIIHNTATAKQRPWKGGGYSVCPRKRLPIGGASSNRTVLPAPAMGKAWVLRVLTRTGTQGTHPHGYSGYSPARVLRVLNPAQYCVPLLWATFGLNVVQLESGMPCEQPRPGEGIQNPRVRLFDGSRTVMSCQTGRAPWWACFGMRGRRGGCGSAEVRWFAPRFLNGSACGRRGTDRGPASLAGPSLMHP